MSIINKKFFSIDVGVRNLAFAIVEYPFEVSDVILGNDVENNQLTQPWSKLKISHLELLDIVHEVTKDKIQRAGAKPKNAKNLNIHVLCSGIVKALHERQGLLDGVTDIRVEQQPMLRSRFSGGNHASVGSSRMKVIQHCLLTFFEVYYLLNPQLPKPSIMPSSASNKLKCVIDANNFCMEPLATTDKNTTYTQRKEKSVENFSKFINWCDISQEHKSMFGDLSKQNDLSDCVLQALYDLQMFGSKLTKPKKIPKAVKPKSKSKKKSSVNINLDADVENKNTADADTIPKAAKPKSKSKKKSSVNINLDADVENKNTTDTDTITSTTTIKRPTKKRKTK
jgi:hypothetical protein